MEQPIPLKSLSSHTHMQHGIKPLLKQAVLLLTTVSSVAMLSGCGISNPFASVHPDQVLVQNRHAPLYNQQDQAMARQAPQPAATPTNNAVLGPGKNDNYDYYSASAPQQAAQAPVQPFVQTPVQAAPQAQTDTSGSLGTLNPAPIRTDRSMRKPLSENIYNAQSTMVPNSTGNGMQAPAQVASLDTSPMMVATAPQPVVDMGAAEQKSAERPGFFSRLFAGSGSKENTDTSPPPWKTRGEFDTASISDSEKNAPYAPLSSVPPTPSNFKDIRANRDQDIQDLQNDHTNAQAQRQMLNTEPSQQQTITPVEMPGNNAPVYNTSPVINQTSTDPRIPRRGIDIMTQDQWDAMQRAKLMQQSIPPVMQQPIPVNNGMVPMPQPNYSPAPMQNMQPLQGMQPQSKVPVAVDPVAENSSLPTPATQKADVSSEHAPTTEVAEHRPSFFAHLFTPSHNADGVKDEAPADAQVAAQSDAQSDQSKDKPQKAQMPQWLQALIPESHADENPAPLPEPKVIMPKQAAAPEPVAASDNDAASPKLMGEMSDNTMLKLASSQQNTVILPLPKSDEQADKAEETAAANVPASFKEQMFASNLVTPPGLPAPKASEEAAENPASAAPAANDNAKPEEKEMHSGSFLSRLFSQRTLQENSQESAPEKTAVATTSPQRKEQLLANNLATPPSMDPAPAEKTAATEETMTPAPSPAPQWSTSESPLHRSPFVSPMAPKPQAETAAPAKADTTTAADRAKETTNATPAPEVAAAKDDKAALAETTPSEKPSRPSFFAGLFIAKKPNPAAEDNTAKDTSQTPAADTASAVAPITPTAEAASALAPASNNAAATAAPISTPAPQTSQTPSASSAAVVPVAAGDGVSSLPSPDLLDQVKMMPASRYSGRLQGVAPGPNN